MFGGAGNPYTNECVKLRQVSATCDFKVKQTEENQKKFLTLENQIKTYSELIQGMDEVLTKIRPWIKDLQGYNAQKKQDALLAINSALSIASNIVPSASGGMRFRIDGKEAWLESEDGLEADMMEGSGYRGVVSVYLRNVVLRSNPNILQFLVLDEPFAKLATENSVIASTYATLLAEGMQIIWIEQKKEVFANLEDKVVYSFFKDDKGNTMCLREEN